MSDPYRHFPQQYVPLNSNQPRPTSNVPQDPRFYTPNPAGYPNAVQCVPVSNASPIRGQHTYGTMTGGGGHASSNWQQTFQNYDQQGLARTDGRPRRPTACDECKRTHHRVRVLYSPPALFANALSSVSVPRSLLAMIQSSLLAEPVLLRANRVLRIVGDAGHNSFFIEGRPRIVGVVKCFRRSGCSGSHSATYHTQS